MADPQQSFRREVHDALQERFLEAVSSYDLAVEVDGGVEDKGKRVERFAKILGLFNDQRDPMSNLPMFNIVFENGGVQVSAAQALPQAAPAPVLEVEDLPVLDAQPVPPPTTEPDQDDPLDVLDQLLGAD